MIKEDVLNLEEKVRSARRTLDSLEFFRMDFWIDDHVDITFRLAGAGGGYSHKIELMKDEMQVMMDVMKLYLTKKLEAL